MDIVVDNIFRIRSVYLILHAKPFQNVFRLGQTLPFGSRFVFLHVRMSVQSWCFYSMT